MKKTIFFWLIILFNLLGAAYGFIYYYAQQLASTPLHLLVFVPDCPLYSLLFALTLILLFFKKEFHWFYFLSFVGALKYGFWTIFVLTSFSPFYFSPSTAVMYSVLFLAHIGLFLETGLVLGKIKTKKIHLLLALAWFLLNDLSDYFFATHPPIPLTQLNFIFLCTLAMTVFFSFAAYFALKSWKKPLIEFFE